jgi:chromosome segregation ATPase
MSEGWPELRNPGPHSQIGHPAERLLETHPQDAVREAVEMGAGLHSGNLPGAAVHGAEAGVHAVQETREAIKNMEHDHAEVASELNHDQVSVDENQEAIDKRQETVEARRDELDAERTQIENEQRELGAKPQAEWSQKEWAKQTDLWKRRIENDHEMEDLDTEQKWTNQRQEEVDQVQKNIDDWRTTSPKQFDEKESKGLAQENEEAAKEHRTQAKQDKETAEQHRKQFEVDEQGQAEYLEKMDQLKESKQDNEGESMKGLLRTDAGREQRENTSSAESQSPNQSNHPPTQEGGQTQTTNSEPSQSQEQSL